MISPFQGSASSLRRKHHFYNASSFQGWLIARTVPSVPLVSTTFRQVLLEEVSVCGKFPFLFVFAALSWVGWCHLDFVLVLDGCVFCGLCPPIDSEFPVVSAALPMLFRVGVSQYPVRFSCQIQCCMKEETLPYGVPNSLQPFGKWPVTALWGLTKKSDLSAGLLDDNNVTFTTV